MNKKEQEKQLLELKQAWQFVMGSNQGRMVIQNILDLCGHGMSPFVNGGTNATIKNVGMQDVGRLIANAAMAHAFDDYIKLMKEGNEHG